MHLQGIPAAVIGAWIGHKDASLTMRLYAHSQDTALKAAGEPTGSPRPRSWTLDSRFTRCATSYASLCLAAGIRPVDIAELMGHRDVKTTLTVYAHLINTDDHTGNMAALGALAAPITLPSNVIPLLG